MSRRPSLRRRLGWLVGVPVLALWLAAGGWLAQRTVHETGEMFDRELQRTAASVLAAMATRPDDSASAHLIADRHTGDRESRPEIVVRDRSGRTVLDASTLPAQPSGAKSSFGTLRVHGASWRVYQRWDAAHRYWIQVAAPLHDREQLLAAQFQALLIPIAVLLLLLPLAIWLALRSGLAPIDAISRVVAARPSQTPKLTREDVPAELLHLTRALDELVADLDAALRRERRFTADAAHELRHPMAVLRMELDLAGVAAEADARAMHLQRARHGLARMERLVAQLLTLARVDSLDHLADTGPLNLAALVRRVVAAAGEHAAPRGIELSLRVDAEVQVQGSPGLLEIAVRNLVDNAIAHGKPRGAVVVSISRHAATAELAVDDDGQGLPDAQAARLGERFLRGSDSRGSGLGLSIVQAIAVLHAGSLTATRSELGGARLVLHLPVAAVTASTRTPAAASPARRA